MHPAIQIIAKREGETPETIQKAIQEAIDAAWGSPDPTTAKARKNLTDSPTAPSADELIQIIVQKTLERMKSAE